MMETKGLNKRKLENNVSIDDEKIKKSEVYKEKGNELFKKSNYDEALDYYMKSITLNPNDHRCYGNIGQILILKGRFPEAKEVLEAAIELNSNYTKAYYRLGLVEKHLKNYEEALQNFDRALKLEPNNKATINECKEIQKINSIQWSKIQLESVQKALFDKNQSNDSIVSTKVSPQSDIVSKTKSIDAVRNTKSIHLKPSVKNIKFPKIEIPFKLPDSSPKTSYQFNLFWREIKDKNQKVEYLKFVGASNFLRLFQTNLEPDFFSELIVLFSYMDESLALQLLNAITKVDNFEFALMFLSKQEKDTLKQIIQSLNANQLIFLYKL